MRKLPRSSPEEALGAANLLIASYPNQKAQNVEVYMQQLTVMLTGIPSEVLIRIANPNRGGIVAESTFLPSLAEIKDWLERKTQHYRDEEKRAGNEIETLTLGVDPAPPTPEERQRRLDVSASVASTLRPAKPKANDLEWMKPESEQTEHCRRDDESLKRVQASDHSALLETPLMQAERKSDAA